MKKRLLSAFLAIALCLGLAVPAFAEEPDFVIEDGELTKYNGPGGDVVIPRTVTKIGTWSFLERDDITSITIPNTVTVIGINAFRDCGGLTSISIPASVTELGNLTPWCPNLAEVKVDANNPNYTARDGVLFSKDMKTLIECPPGKVGAYSVPNGVNEICYGAFRECTRLTSITLPNSITTIPEMAFLDCTGPENIFLPDSLTTIEFGAFSGCDSLTTLTIPASVTYIGMMMAQVCPSLTSIEVDPGNKNYTSVDGVLYTKDMEILHTYPAGKSGALNIPDGVRIIAYGAAHHSSHITSVTIPGSVTLIDTSAFEGCSGLTSVTISEGVTKIGAAAFSATGLTEVTIPSSVTNLKNSPFKGSKLTSITVDPNNKVYTSIDGVLYSKDTKTLVGFPHGKAKDWTIPNHVTSIGSFAFSEPMFGDEHVLTSVAMPSSVTKLESGAFYNCSNLTDIYYSGSKADWEKINIAGDNDSLETAVIHYNSTAPAPATAPSFTDVPSWFETEVAWAVEKKITNGYGGSTTFAPNVECPHTQILTFLYRAADKPPVSAKAPFTVASSYQDAVNWAYEKGLIDDSFNPDALCTRSQAVQYIWQALGKKEAQTAASFSDVAAGASYADAVSWAVEKGVTRGYGGADTFAPDRVCTRGEIAAFLYRAYNN